MPGKQIRFVTDSTCDLPREIIERHQIGIIPCFVNYGGESYADDGIHFNRDAFYAQMPTIHPPATTAAPPPGLAEKVIHETFEGADHLVIVTVPQTLSGVYNTCRLASSDLPQDRITLVDSGTTSMYMGFQVLAGAEAAEATGDLNAVLAAIDGARQRGRLYAALATLDNLRHSGRVSWAAAGLGALLQIKPIIELRDGVVESVARVRTFGKATEELMRLTREKAPLERLALLHIHNREGTERMKHELADVSPQDCWILDATPVLGTHTGTGALGVALVSRA